MIPLRDVIPSRTTPGVTILVIASNVMVFLFMASLAPRAAEAFIYVYGLVPADFSFVNVFTSIFVHGGLAHVAGNMWFLWIFGDNVEDRFGHGRFIVFYLVCGFVAAISQAWLDPTSQVPMVGASGAIAG
jgi:membrane associated rhomboid family serine protease